MAPQEKIVCVVGPTACGKTKLGVLLARAHHGEVVSVDSMQIYRGMTVGTAAPTPEEMAGVPHHMVAVAEPGENWSVARFAAEADRCVRDILARGKLPILVGGTGLYLEAVVSGRDFAPGQGGGQVRARLQDRLEREGIGPLLTQLRQVTEEAGVSMQALALAFLRAESAVGSILVGVRSVKQLEENLAAFTAEVPADALERARGLSAALRDRMGDNADLWENENGGRMR